MYSLPNSLEAFRADLHCHSSCSDGTLTPQELIDLAIASGLSALSITDHDTLDAYQEGLPHAQSRSFILVPGVELSCVYRKQSVHILAYDFSMEDAVLQDYCVLQQKKREERNRAILHRLCRLSMPITEEELKRAYPQSHTIGRPHIASVMCQKGYVRSIQQAFQSYLGDTGCCFVLADAPSVEEGIAEIHKAGGKAFLAHPHLYTREGFVRELLEFPFDGIECYYGNFDSKWVKLAEEKGLLISGGSDFHGSIKSHTRLGSGYVDYAGFAKIFSSRAPKG